MRLNRQEKAGEIADDSLIKPDFKIQCREKQAKRACFYLVSRQIAPFFDMMIESKRFANFGRNRKKG